jgi:hypothetical protein
MTGTNSKDRPALVLQLTIPLMAKDADEDERKEIYRSLLKVSWWPRKLRYAINEALGRSTQTENAEIQQGKALFATYMIAESKALLRRRGWPRGSGSIDVAALEQTAPRLRMTRSALAKLVRDHGPKGEERRRLQAKAQRIALSLLFSRLEPVTGPMPKLGDSFKNQSARSAAQNDFKRLQPSQLESAQCKPTLASKTISPTKRKRIAANGREENESGFDVKPKRERNESALPSMRGESSG